MTEESPLKARRHHTVWMMWRDVSMCGLVVDGLRFRVRRDSLREALYPALLRFTDLSSGPSNL